MLQAITHLPYAQIMHTAKVAFVTTTAPIIYGIANDLLQKDACPEFWTKDHLLGGERLVSVEYPIWNAVKWGIYATSSIAISTGVFLTYLNNNPFPGANRGVDASALAFCIHSLLGVNLAIGEYIFRNTHGEFTKKIADGVTFQADRCSSSFGGSWPCWVARKWSPLDYISKSLSPNKPFWVAIANNTKIEPSPNIIPGFEACNARNSYGYQAALPCIMVIALIILLKRCRKTTS